MQKLLAACAAFAFCLLTITGLCEPAQAAEVKTGVGLSEHVLKAHTENWKYSYGSYGQLRNGSRYTDCSGLIKSYLWWTGEKTNPNSNLLQVSGTGSGMLKAAKTKGTINYSNWSSLPRTHGLILFQPGHVGVYVGNNVGIDNRDVGYNMKKEPVFGRAKNKWTTWFKLNQLSYPTTGFVTYDGNQYYYENGEYAVKTTRTIGDKIYNIGADGIITGSALTPEAKALEAAALTQSAENKPATAAVQQTAAGDPVPDDVMQAVEASLVPARKS